MLKHSRRGLVPVVLAVVQKRMSVSTRAVCANIRVPTSHGTSRDVILHMEKKVQVPLRHSVEPISYTVYCHRFSVIVHSLQISASITTILSLTPTA